MELCLWTEVWWITEPTLLTATRLWAGKFLPGSWHPLFLENCQILLRNSNLFSAQIWSQNLSERAYAASSENPSALTREPNLNKSCSWTVYYVTQNGVPLLLCFPFHGSPLELRWQGTENKAQSLGRHNDVEPAANTEALVMMYRVPSLEWHVLMTALHTWTMYLYSLCNKIKPFILSFSLYSPLIFFQGRQRCTSHTIDHTTSPHWNPFSLFREWNLQYFELSVTRTLWNHEICMYEKHQEVQVSYNWHREAKLN